MKALILNSGMGTRMGKYTKEHPKCMTDITENDSIISRQLKLIVEAGIKDVVITIGYFDQVLIDYCYSLELPLNYSFVMNPLYRETNYIYSIYCARNELMNDDIIMIHGDLVFEKRVLEQVLNNPVSCMTVSSTIPLPEKDFKAVIQNDRITKVGIEFFENAMAAQPLYKIKKSDWKIWIGKIIAFCEDNNRKCYAEKAFNQVSDECFIYPLDVKDALCSEIDTPDDLLKVISRIKSFITNC